MKQRPYPQNISITNTPTMNSRHPGPAHDYLNTIPSELLILICESLESTFDLLSFSAAYPRGKLLLQHHLRVILERCIGGAVHPANIEILLTTHFIMRYGVYVDGRIALFKRDYSKISILEALRVVETPAELWDIFAIITHVNRLCLLYSYPGNATAFWEKFSSAYKELLPADRTMTSIGC